MRKNQGLVKNSVIIFGGTFAPFHDGHAKICKLLLKKNLQNRLILVPSAKKYYKSENHSELSESCRLKIIQIMLKQYKISPNIVSRFELDNVIKPTPTYLTLDYFKKIHPKKQVYFLIGDDILNTNIELWENFNLFGRKYRFIIARRNEVLEKDKFSEEVAKFYKKSICLNNPIFIHSSTKFREGKQLPQFHKKLLNFSNQNSLFWRTRLTQMISKKRQTHSYNVAKLAVFYGAKNGINKRNLFFAGIYHDMYKNTENYSKDFIKQHLTIEQQKFEAPVWHGFICASVLEAEWNVSNKEILAAIRNHTVPSLSASLFEKIIYCADKLSYERDDKSYLRTARELAKKDIPACFCRILYEEIKILYEKKKSINKYYKALVDKYLPREQITEINNLFCKNKANL